MAANTVSPTANVVLVLYLAFLMLVIGYGTDTCNSFGNGRIDGEQGRQLLQSLAKADDVGQRLAMAVLINFRINQTAWYAIWFTSIYGLFLPMTQRAPIHVLGLVANAFTCTLLVWHLFGGDNAMVPSNDPYHKIPVPFDAAVTVITGVALVVVVLANQNKSSQEKQD